MAASSSPSLPDHLRPIPPPPWGNPRPALPLRLRGDLACPALLLRDARAPVPFVAGTRPLLLRSYRAYPPPHSRTPERLSHRRPPHAPTLAVLYLYPAIRISPVPRGSLNTPAPHRLHLPGRIQWSSAPITQHPRDSAIAHDHHCAPLRRLFARARVYSATPVPIARWSSNTRPIPPRPYLKTPSSLFRHRRVPHRTPPSHTEINCLSVHFHARASTPRLPQPSRLIPASSNETPPSH